MINGVVQGSEVIRAEKYDSDANDTDAYHHQNSAGQPGLCMGSATHTRFREVIPLAPAKKSAVFYIEPLLFMLRPMLMAIE